MNQIDIIVEELKKYDICEKGQRLLIDEAYLASRILAKLDAISQDQILKLTPEPSKDNIDIIVDWLKKLLDENFEDLISIPEIEQYAHNLLSKLNIRYATKNTKDK